MIMLMKFLLLAVCAVPAAHCRVFLGAKNLMRIISTISNISCFSAAKNSSHISTTKIFHRVSVGRTEILFRFLCVNLANTHTK